jgi:hypothetical protein
MKIKHKIDFVTGDFDTENGKLICVKSPKYGMVELCIKECGWNIPIAQIKLHSRDRAVDADRGCLRIG